MHLQQLCCHQHLCAAVGRGLQVSMMTSPAGPASASARALSEKQRAAASRPARYYNLIMHPCNSIASRNYLESRCTTKPRCTSQCERDRDVRMILHRPAFFAPPEYFEFLSSFQKLSLERVVFDVVFRMAAWTSNGCSSRSSCRTNMTGSPLDLYRSTNDA